MNPKGVNDLDPKLKETYERVMGTTFPTPQPVSQQTTAQTPTQQPPQQPVESVQTPEPQPVLQPISTPSDPMQTSQIFRAGDGFKQPPTSSSDLLAKANMGNSAVVNEEPKKKSKLIPMLIGVGGLIFFIAYAVIWAKLFGLF